jgi:hypothetical protein
MWLVKEGMRMYESTLAASFDEEDSIKHQLAKMRVKIEQLEEKKRKLKQDIRDHVVDASNVRSQNCWRNAAHYWSCKIASGLMSWMPLMSMATWRLPESVEGRLKNSGIMLERPPIRPNHSGTPLMWFFIFVVV